MWELDQAEKELMPHFTHATPLVFAQDIGLSIQEVLDKLFAFVVY